MIALLLEDDPVRGAHIRDLLKQNGYHVVWAKSFRAGKEAWRQTKFDLATLDHDLGPVLRCGTGRMFTRWVVQQPNVCQTKFIVHSANVWDAPRMVQDLVDAGCHVARVWPDSVGVYLATLKNDPQPPAGGR